MRWARFPQVTELLESAGADLLGMLLAEQDDEQGGTGYFSAESMAQLRAPTTNGEVEPALLMAS